MRRPAVSIPWAFSGDGSFTKNPQSWLDGVEHGVRGCVVLFDNRRMAAISGASSNAQYGRTYKTSDAVESELCPRMAGSVTRGAPPSTAVRRPNLIGRRWKKPAAHEGISVGARTGLLGDDSSAVWAYSGTWNVGTGASACRRSIITHRL